MNKFIGMGFLTRDAEVSTSQSGVVVARTGMALDRGKDKEGKDRGADFINLVGFNKTAEFMQKYCTKGRRFLIEAHVQTGSYDAQDGHKVYTTDFIIDRIEFADSKSDSQPAPQPTPDADGFMGVDDSDLPELPFN